MLADREIQLLTAYVDGGPSPRGRKIAVELLQQSAEARALLEQFQHDAARLNSLPRHALGGEFSAQVLQAVHTVALPIVAKRAARVRDVPAWLGVALAAAILLMVSGGAF